MSLDSQHDIVNECNNIRDILLEKNRKYGDAVLNPDQVFSSTDPIELINVRLDDKLSRIRNRQSDENEDAELDLIGYLILKRIAIRRIANEGL